MISSNSLLIPQFSTNPNLALDFYNINGYHIEMNVWSENEILNINEAASDIASINDNLNYSPIIHGDRYSAVFLNSAKNSKIINIVKLILGKDIFGLQTVYYFCKPGTKGFTLHQDNFYVKTSKDAFLTSWSPLIDVNSERGSLVAYPGSHKEEILEVADSFIQPGTDQPAALECILPFGYFPISLDAPKGSCVFMHGHLVHSSCNNNSNLFRKTFLTTYIKSGHIFNPGKTERNLIDLNL